MDSVRGAGTGADSGVEQPGIDLEPLEEQFREFYDEIHDATRHLRRIADALENRDGQA